jgi:hypothetical protein
MTDLNARVMPAGVNAINYIHWPSIIAGAIAAAALASVLHSFAFGIGLTASSAAPTWRDASFALVFLSGLYLLIVAVLSYGFGAYAASLLRPRGIITGSDIEFGDGMHGLLVWALATLLTALLVAAIGLAVPRLATAGSTSGPSASLAAENVIAYDLDRLFRSDRRPTGDVNYARAEAGRILLTTTSHRGMQPDDRTYLVHLVSTQTGLGAAEAQTRVDNVAAQAKQNLDRARHVALLISFMAGAAALIGAAAAWYSAIAAARHREGLSPLHPLWDWTKKVEY